MPEPAIVLRDVVKSFADHEAVRHVSLEVESGEFFTMLGPSGSGKTTLLRMIAGFESPDAGSIIIQGVDMTVRPAHLRPVNTVFQDYALFPHMDVLTNVEYGMRVRRVDKNQRRARAQAALEMVQLANFAGRRPAQLSGGQRQRVALARAIVNEPAVLLLDEPLGALDLKLRQDMQIELKAIQRRVGITFVYVTHDQEEAMAMSDRIAIINLGQIEQLGTPREVYENPETPFVARFIGTSNIIERDGRRWSLRPERLELASVEASASTDGRVESGTVVDTVYLGMNTRHVIRLDSGENVVVVRTNARAAAPLSAEVGQRVAVTWRESDAVVLTAN